jgi:AmmeMemoRadiSam system protein A
MSKLSETASSQPSENPAGQAPALATPGLSREQRRTLLGIAHEAILHGLEHRPFPGIPPASPVLSEPRGVFTTLYLGSGLHGQFRGELGYELRSDADPRPEPHRLLPDRQLPDRQLRGCVGYAMPVAPLYRAVAETARAAAFEDSRFFPVTREEAPRLEVSLSVLSRLFAIHPDAVEVGRHGLVVSQGGRRGLLLPQVPTEHDWDRETFLEQTCRKAGLPEDAWRKGASIEAFTAEVFCDADVAMPC